MLKETLIKYIKNFSENDYINSLLDVEIVSFAEKEMADPGRKVLDINTINEIYQQILSSNDKNEASINCNYKKHLKELISKNICGISFVKSKNPGKSDQLISDNTTSEILNISNKECTAVNRDQIWKSC